MKLSAIYKMAKKNKTAQIITGEGGRQWIIVNGGLMYPLDGMPALDEETLLTMMDVPEDERGKWSIRQSGLTEYMSQFVRDNTDGDREASRASIMIDINDETYQPVYTAQGLVLVAACAFAPVADSARTYQLYSRVINDQPVVLVKNGFQLIGTFCRTMIPDEKAAEELADAARHIREDAKRRKAEEQEHDGEQQRM